MMNKITDLVNENLRTEYATTNGRNVHAQMQRVFYTPNGWVGNENIINRLSNITELKEFMGPLSRTEVPIAGTINGKFISRRIDRLYVNNDAKKVVVLDYKTDIDKKIFAYESFDNKIKNCIWDGQGFLDNSVFENPDIDNRNDVGHYQNNSMMILRNRFFKFI